MADIAERNERLAQDLAMVVGPDQVLTDPELMEMLRARFFAPRSDAVVRRVELAVERGELLPGIDAELVPAVLTGALQYTRRVRSRSACKASAG